MTDLSQLIAQQFCVGVVGMYHSGIGGGGFMLVRSANGTYEFIDFRETVSLNPVCSQKAPRLLLFFPDAVT